MGAGFTLGSDCQLGEGVGTFGCHSAWRQVRGGGSEVLRDDWTEACSSSWKWLCPQQLSWGAQAARIALAVSEPWCEGHSSTSVSPRANRA